MRLDVTASGATVGGSAVTLSATEHIQIEDPARLRAW
jgi:hypothetical protein